MLRPRLIRPPDLLKESNTYANMSMTFWKRPIINIRNNMTNIRFHTSSRWGIRLGYICRKRGSSEPNAS